ncbi:hypothetical protein [Convivina intestini]|uniref:Uncharacterized protein n=1 Tax=Convivina intestini TaxID=1505726 RepID=A0A2U1D7Q0_9LACO|nr:hypothetical protein [Convivina intestini]PVY83705.1 hypothetical protein C7384_10615 [Convivina intestini]CAH1853287.1 hypothetical protein R078131_00725 [Convivina intestini]CAH1855154.1 hypothetical protein R077811_01005 [Convivina intestini]SDB92243.1 hypothetical protein SAMN05216341_10516 [Leuconostocaceae bacterium R-53105]
MVVRNDNVVIKIDSTNQVERLRKIFKPTKTEANEKAKRVGERFRNAHTSVLRFKSSLEHEE